MPATPQLEERDEPGSHDAFDFIQVLRAELNREKELEALKMKEGEVVSVAERRQMEVEEYVRILTTRQDLEEMPVMMFRRLMHDDEVLSAVSKHILDAMFP